VQIEDDQHGTARTVWPRGLTLDYRSRRRAPAGPLGMTRWEAGAKGGRGKKALDNIKGFSGTSEAYLAARLKRDAPDEQDVQWG
jgi:hypothetical protein